jgi:hypothetical protein
MLRPGITYHCSETLLWVYRDPAKQYHPKPSAESVQDIFLAIFNLHIRHSEDRLLYCGGHVKKKQG